MSHAEKRPINMKHIKRDFDQKFASEPLGGLRTTGSKVKIQTFSEHVHVAYRIKGNHECSSMVGNILPVDPHPITPTP